MYLKKSQVSKYSCLSQACGGVARWLFPGKYKSVFLEAETSAGREWVVNVSSERPLSVTTRKNPASLHRNGEIPISEIKMTKKSDKIAKKNKQFYICSKSPKQFLFF